jgi:hypothetical protein
VCADVCGLSNATARTGSKHHLIVDGHGVPLAATLTVAIAMTSRSCSPSLTASARSVANAVGLASDLTR